MNVRLTVRGSCRALAIVLPMLIASAPILAHGQAAAPPAPAAAPAETPVAPTAALDEALNAPIAAEPAPVAAPIAAAPEAKVETPSVPAEEAGPASEPKPSFDAQFGKGATFRSADETFTLNIRGRVQAKTSLTIPDEGDKSSEMVIRRMRLVFQGNAIGPELTYYIQLAFSNQDNEPDLRSPLRDAYMTWAPLRDLNVRVGQMKVQFGRQRVVSSSALQMVDRSIVVGELNLDRDVGISLFSKDLFGLDGKLGYNVSIYGGEGRNRLGRELGYLYSARLEAWPLGSFDDYVEADIKRDPKPRLAIGAGAAYNQKTNRPRSTIGDPYPAGDFNYLHATADMMFKMSGFSFQSEVIYRDADKASRNVDVDGVTETIASRSAWGAYGQAGQMLTERLEIEARYGYLKPLSGNEDKKLLESHELGGGLSYYIREHNLKLQGDYFYLPTGGFDNGAQQARVQMQLFF